ncbi:hypothetical protein V2J74_10065 [Pseudomonas alliivorans]|nr:hypothetical protein [Pseudomonas alliivorans]
MHAPPSVSGGGKLVWDGVLRVTGMEPDPLMELNMSFEDDDGLSGYVGELLEAGYLTGAAEGVAKRFLADEPLSDAQQNVFDKYVLAENDPGRCIRGCDIPWSEKYEAKQNGGMCAYCAHQAEKVMRDN